MSWRLLAVALGAIAGSGLMLIVAALGDASGRLYVRVAPYVAPADASCGIVASPRERASRAWRRAAGHLDQLLGGRAKLTRRIQAAGWDFTSAAFRASQLQWAAIGLALGLLASLAAARTRGTPLPILVALCLAGPAAGYAVRDWTLSKAIARRKAAICAELPALAELLALAVAAGLSVPAALERVVGQANGAAADELANVLANVQSGARLTEALDARARVCPAPPMTRLFEAVAAAVERGAPLAAVLHAQAGDVREESRRQLIETGGRKEIAMLVPVVFLILPVTVVFAVFPGLMSLRLIV